MDKKMSIRKIDRNVPIPVYYQLKEIILEKIRSGEWKKGDKIPSEPWLSISYSISKMTARQSITELCNEGVLYRIRGKGTFVAKPRFERDLSSLNTFTENIKGDGHEVSTIVLTLKTIPASKEVARDLEINHGEKVIQLDRLRIVDGVPFYLDKSFLSHELCAPLISVAERLVNESLHSILENDFGLNIDHALTSVEAAVCGKLESGILKTKKGTPVLRMKHIIFLIDGRPIQIADMIVRSDKIKYTLIRKKKR